MRGGGPGIHSPRETRSLGTGEHLTLALSNSVDAPNPPHFPLPQTEKKNIRFIAFLFFPPTGALFVRRRHEGQQSEVGTSRGGNCGPAEPGREEARRIYYYDLLLFGKCYRARDARARASESLKVRPRYECAAVHAARRLDNKPRDNGAGKHRTCTPDRQHLE